MALVAGILATGRPGGPTAGASTSPGASQAAGSPAKSTTAPGPTGSEPPEDAWSAAVLPPFAAVADLRADRADATGVRLDTTFTLASLAGADPRSLATRLESDPELSLTVAAGPTPTSVTPAPGPAARRRDVPTGSPSGPRTAASPARGRSSRGRRSTSSSTLPGDATTDVPIDTGIEVTFDQDGAGDIADYFSISPAVKGRFERNGRTQVFVPNGLRRATLYTVTIRHGLPVQGTDLTLEKDVRFRFETAGLDGLAGRSRFRVGRDVLESSPTDRPVIGLEVDPARGRRTARRVKPPTTVDVRVYRFPSLESTLASMRAFLDAPSWTEATDPTVPTTGLPQVHVVQRPPSGRCRTSADHVIVVPDPAATRLVPRRGRAGRRGEPRPSSR